MLQGLMQLPMQPAETLDAAEHLNVAGNMSLSASYAMHCSPAHALDAADVLKGRVAKVHHL